jgi:hypothetical protein
MVCTAREGERHRLFLEALLRPRLLFFSLFLFLFFFFFSRGFAFLVGWLFCFRDGVFVGCERKKSKKPRGGERKKQKGKKRGEGMEWKKWNDEMGWVWRTSEKTKKKKERKENAFCFFVFVFLGWRFSGGEKKQNKNKKTGWTE